jgi:copper chaperone
MCSTNTVGNELGLTDTNHACACGTGDHAETTAQVSEDAIREHYFVEGMTCSHCVSSVTEEVSAVEGVESVSVRLNAGGASQIMVVSSRPVEVEAIRTAVTEAGYTLVSA